ncbi:MULTISPECIES: hypothetical protein [Herbaspirillum]|uniref:hypothetical protein n=1 Tax=Herbaspirillum TaxID=963 RepID=UPI000C0ACF88|nr:hypothetical protein [Herbaspirillum sp.]MAF04424.1 hypothetical protein [Herbaspirillum sp.]MBO18289.1 hypothetical protein [Herbaspirillum sp.]|tara:strand:- start:20247 stop:20690 length:444 start_codon:yes stop_codon:yes gene_type:complete
MQTTEAGFLDFIRNVAGIPTSALPDASPYIDTAYQIAIALTSLELQCLSNGLIYSQAVYNLGVSNILNWAPDQSGSTYFSDLRKEFGINSFVGGTISSSADVSTSESLLTPDFLKGLTLANLQQLKDPFGRQWLMYQQSIGTVWGIS